MRKSHLSSCVKQGKLSSKQYCWVLLFLTKIHFSATSLNWSPFMLMGGLNFSTCCQLLPEKLSLHSESQLPSWRRPLVCDWSNSNVFVGGEPPRWVSLWSMSLFHIIFFTWLMTILRTAWVAVGGRTLDWDDSVPDSTWAVPYGWGFQSGMILYVHTCLDRF